MSSGDIVVDGEAIGLDDGQGGLDTPPVILYGVGGKITEIVVSSGGLDYSI